MGQLLGPDFPSDIALAVSGGGDSMAMLTLAHNWTRVWGVRLWVVTVDHGLRPESAEEAAMVAEECRLLGWPHAVLRWHWDGEGNKMDAARRARLDLIDRWRGGVGHVLMAHTRDDLAETFLMRLKRGSGADGLAAMAARRQVAPGGCSEGEIFGEVPPGNGRHNGFDVVRPCLGFTRDELRHYLRVLKGQWVEDPSNEDPAYDRARLRRLLPLLAAEGLDREALASTAERLREDATALRLRAAEAWDTWGAPMVTADGADTGILILHPDWTRLSDSGTQRRLLVAMLRYVSGADYAPRAEALDALRERMVSGGGGTLHGCDVIYHKSRILMFREFAPVAGAVGETVRTGIWDGRWQVAETVPGHFTIRALGEDGWRQAHDRAEGAPPYRAALSLPSIWEGDRLVACDGLGIGPGQTVRLCRAGGVRGFLLSH